MEEKRKKKSKGNLSEFKQREKDASLPWKNVSPDDPVTLLAGSSQGGFLCLEELDGEFYSEFTSGALQSSAGGEFVPGHGGSLKHKITKKRKKTKKFDLLDDSSLSNGLVKSKKKMRKEEVEEPNLKACNTEMCNAAQAGGDDSSEGSSFKNGWSDGCKDQPFQDERLSAWVELRLHENIMRALSSLGFFQPTAIQRDCIPAAAHQGKDIIGAAETGSGKTLAYVIPVIQRLLDEEEKYLSSANIHDDGSTSNIRESKGFLRALILTPTRELALQVCKHFKEAAKFTTIKVVPIVGGMSVQKQERLLKRRPDVIVGTPGRLWELMSVGDQHLTELRYLSFFVLDEADRMIEKGHFQELQSIMSLLPVVDNRKGGVKLQSDLSSLDASSTDFKGIHRRQTFVFSATLALPVGFRKKLKQGLLRVKQQSQSDEYSVAFLSDRAGVRPNAAIIDLTTQNVVADKLEESIIQCREGEKDFFLYYLLKLHGLGRSIIFCTSIAALRHVAAVLSILQVQAWPLHAQMQQRQRLKYMDRFQRKEDSCLISTDVAARGLDIPGVRTVIHYQLPHSAEIYVHRSGRTARASKDGCSILLVTPSDQIKFLSLCNALSKKEGFPSFPCNTSYLPAVTKRVQLAQKIDALSRKNAQARAKKSWFKRNADALEVDVDEGLDERDLSGDLSEKKKAFELRKLHQELKVILDEPLEPKALSHRFITGAGISPLLASQLKDYAIQKAQKKQKDRLMKSAKMGREREKRGLVVIGQEMVEPLDVLRSSRN